MRGPLVIVGDALLDIDALGTAERLSPDAPVPVVSDICERTRPGGAALAALLAARDGLEVVLVTAWGDDGPGETLAGLLQAVHVIRIPYAGATPVKYRVRAGGQSLVRLDHGSALGTYEPAPSAISDVLSSAGAVLASDYGRGLLARDDIRSMLSGRPSNTPLVWDPHPKGADPLSGTQLMTPNADEAKLLAERVGASDSGGTRLARAQAHAAALVRHFGVRGVAVTMGSGGALLTYGHGLPTVCLPPDVTCLDPCGAGDRFAVSVAASLGSGLIPPEAVQQAVHTASQYVAAGGPASLEEDAPPVIDDVPLTWSVVVERTRASKGVVVATGGCFDLLHAGHVATLRAARRLGDCLVVCVNSDESVQRLKGPTRPLVSVADRVQVLEALECVDAVVVFGEDTPVQVVQAVQPDLWVKGGDYTGDDVPEAATVAAWGGQTVVLPYLPGHSTTRLVDTAASAGVSAHVQSLTATKETMS